MNVTYACCQCDQTNRQELDQDSRLLRCRHCGYEQGIPEGAIQYETSQAGYLRRCVVCPSHDLFLRKDFSQQLGLTIIVLGFIASSVAWFYYRQYLAFGILVGTALIDVLLYLLVGNLLQCYRCRAEYRGLPDLERYESFSLETHERHRQQEARLAEVRRAAASSSPASAAPEASGDSPVPDGGSLAADGDSLAVDGLAPGPEDEAPTPADAESRTRPSDASTSAQ